MSVPTFRLWLPLTQEKLSMNCVTDVVKFALPFAGGPKLLQTDHIVGRQHITEGGERNIGDLRDLSRRLPGRQRGAIESSARETEP